jgi:hypothetical protein
LAMTGVTIYGYFHSELFLNNTEDRNLILGISMAGSLLIVMAALLGICGVKKGNAGLICIFQIFVIIFFIVFLGLGIGGELLPGALLQGNCTDSNNKAIEEANQAYQASIQLCTAICPCGLTNDTINTSTTWSDLQKIALRSMNRIDTGAVNVQHCSIQPKNDTILNMYDVLEGIEKLLDCSMWCEGTSDFNLIYRFSDVNRGKPEKFCYPAMSDAVNSYAHIIGVAAFAVSGFLLLMCLCNLCICCHPSRRDLGLQQRFVYQYDGAYQRV